MAISKVILNGETLMDVTSDTVVAEKMLSGTTATKNDGTKVTGSISAKSSSDLTVSGGTVTAPAGYYSSSASKSVATATHPKPTLSLNSTTGVVTATHAQQTGYVTGGSTSDTLSLSTQSAKTITPTESAQTAVSAGKYTTGAVNVAAIPSDYVGSDIDVDPTPTVSDNTVTIPSGYYSSSTSKSIATTNHPNPTLSLNNSTGVVTATHIQGSGYVTGGTATNTLNLSTQDASVITPTESFQCAVSAGYFTTGVVQVAAISSTYIGTGISRRDSSDIVGGSSTVIIPSGYYSISAEKSILSGSTFPPATTITTNPTITMESSTGIITASYSGASYVTPVVNSGYISQGTSGIIETIGNSTFTLPKQSAQTITPGTSNQTILSNKWLTGDQTILGDADLIPSNIVSGVNIFGVTGNYTDGTLRFISNYSISNYYSIPSITSIGSGKFAYLTMTSISFPEADFIGALAFYRCTSLSSAYINKAHDIGSLAFYCCTKLSSINMQGVYTISQSAFYSCSGLTSVDLPSAGVLNDYAFGDCTKLSYASVPNVTALGTGTFLGCTSLTSISLPLVRSIAYYCFSGCTSLSYVYAPLATHLYTAAFYNCRRLNTIDCSQVSFIGDSCFYSCTNLYSINMPAVSKIGWYAFFNCSSLSTLDLQYLSSVGASAFRSCINLSFVSCPLLAYLEAGAFSGCSNLSSISLPLLSNVANYTFTGCYNLSVVYLNSAENLSTYAFYQCYNLLSLYLLSTSMCSVSSVNTTFGSTPIKGYTTSTGGVYGSIFVRASLYDTYIADTKWKSLSSRFVSLTDDQIAAL